MTFRLALFVAVPSILLYVLAMYLDTKLVAWFAMIGILLAGIIFTFDQL